MLSFELLCCSDLDKRRSDLNISTLPPVLSTPVSSNDPSVLRHCVLRNEAFIDYVSCKALCNTLYGHDFVQVQRATEESNRQFFENSTISKLHTCSILPNCATLTSHRAREKRVLLFFFLLLFRLVRTKKKRRIQLVSPLDASIETFLNSLNDFTCSCSELRKRQQLIVNRSTSVISD